MYADLSKEEHEYAYYHLPELYAKRNDYEAPTSTEHVYLTYED